jgi:sugar lactone lactonase YvrE
MPLSLATDGNGNLYIADEENYRVRVVSAAGTIATVAGNGSYDFQGDGVPAVAAPISGTLGIAVDAAGSLYFADAGNNRVRKVLADGTIATVAGTGVAGYSGDGGPATAAQLSFPSGLAFDGAGNLYIADQYNFVVRKVAPNGVITTLATKSSIGNAGDGGPAAVATDSSGDIFVNTGSGQYVRRISPDGAVTQLLYGGPLMMGGPYFQWPSQYWGIAADASGNLYAADGAYSRLIRVTPNGTTTTLAGAAGSGFSGDGGPAAGAQLSRPLGLGLDGAGNLFIADSNNSAIREISGGNIDTVAGNGTPGYSGDGGLATAAQLRGPTGVAADWHGRIYVADAGNRAIRLLQPQDQAGPVAIHGVNVVSGGADIAQNTWIEIHGAGLAPAALGSGGLRPDAGTARWSQCHGRWQTGIRVLDRPHAGECAHAPRRGRGSGAGGGDQWRWCQRGVHRQPQAAGAHVPGARRHALRRGAARRREPGGAGVAFDTRIPVHPGQARRDRGAVRNRVWPAGNTPRRRLGHAIRAARKLARRPDWRRGRHRAVCRSHQSGAVPVQRGGAAIGRRWRPPGDGNLQRRERLWWSHTGGPKVNLTPPRASPRRRMGPAMRDRGICSMMTSGDHRREKRTERRVAEQIRGG